jgi:hypothetical protein
MPVRTRKSRRRQAAGLEEWESVFCCGFDFSGGELEDAGVRLDAYGRPDLDEARAAWQRFGAEFMQLPRHPLLGPAWALERFGDPCR